VQNNNHSDLARHNIAVNHQNQSESEAVLPDQAELPAWQRQELRIVAAIVQHGWERARLLDDLRIEHFFMDENIRILRILEVEHSKGRRKPKLKGIARRLSRSLAPDQVQRHIALLQKIISGEWNEHLIETIWRFTDERSFLRGLCDAAETIEKYGLGCGAAIKYLFGAVDLPQLKNAQWLGKLQAAILSCPALSHSDTYVPREWRDAFQNRPLDEEAVGVKVLLALRQSYQNWHLRAVPPPYPQPTRISDDDVEIAIGNLSDLGLIRQALIISYNEDDADSVFVPTAKALLPLLK
jgi:hypothetical protein